MTDKTLPIMATADLSPVSPSPLHPSSPVIVPALQQAVDQIDAMAAPQNSQAPGAEGEVSVALATTAAQENPLLGENQQTKTTPGSGQNDNDTIEKHLAEDESDQVTEQSNEAESVAYSENEGRSPEGASNGSPVTVVVHSTTAENGDATPSSAVAIEPNTVGDITSPKDDSIETSEVEASTPAKAEVLTVKPEEKAASALASEAEVQPADDKPAQPESTAKQAAIAVVPGLQGAQHSVASISAASKPSSLPPRPPMPVDALPHVPQSLLVGTSAGRTTTAGITPLNTHYHGQGVQSWDTFQNEERKYVADAKWDRFPDGSRLFIGNLSSERVSKREVFDIFSPFGRLAQISLKQAFGFVQYHMQSEGQAAMDNLQGKEIKGRKINLEFSRTQKRNEDGDRRGSRGKGEHREQPEPAKPRRDDYRPGRASPPPSRTGHRQHGSYNEPPRYDGGRYGSRGRSRSPGYGAPDYNSYRRRSASPQRRQDPESTLDIPRRYGIDVPDVQVLLLQEVERDFVNWVQRPFVDLGLRVDVMFLNPRYPRDAVIQRQVIEGVHAVIDLDFRAQQLGRLSLQVFDRSAGRDKVRFDQYQDLEPHIAAQLVARTRSQTTQYTAPYAAPQYSSAPQYHPAGLPTHHPHAYGNPQYHYQQPAVQPYGGGSAQPPAALDNATLQQLLGTIQSQQGGTVQPILAANGNHVDVNAVLAAFGNNAPAAHGHAQQQHHPQQYSHPAQPGPHAPPAQGGDSAHHVQNIMSQLARYRQ